MGSISGVMGTSMVWLLPVSSMTRLSMTPPRSVVTSAATVPVKGLGTRILAVSPGAYSFLSATSSMRSLFSCGQAT